jgi:hypothetical protein
MNTSCLQLGKWHATLGNIQSTTDARVSALTHITIQDNH